MYHPLAEPRYLMARVCSRSSAPGPSGLSELLPISSLLSVVPVILDTLHPFNAQYIGCLYLYIVVICVNNDVLVYPSRNIVDYYYSAVVVTGHGSSLFLLVTMFPLRSARDGGRPSTITTFECLSLMLVLI